MNPPPPSLHYYCTVVGMVPVPGTWYQVPRTVHVNRTQKGKMEAQNAGKLFLKNTQFEIQFKWI